MILREKVESKSESEKRKTKAKVESKNCAVRELERYESLFRAVNGQVAVSQVSKPLSSLVSQSLAANKEGMFIHSAVNGIKIA